ncbi:MAG: hypothetical protein ACOCRX_03240 [Candidatus Woesearchaeota archaeon]
MSLKTESLKDEGKTSFGVEYPQTIEVNGKITGYKDVLDLGLAKFVLSRNRAIFRLVDKETNSELVKETVRGNDTNSFKKTVEVTAGRYAIELEFEHHKCSGDVKVEYQGSSSGSNGSNGGSEEEGRYSDHREGGEGEYRIQPYPYPNTDPKIENGEKAENKKNVFENVVSTLETNQTAQIGAGALFLLLVYFIYKQ